MAKRCPSVFGLLIVGLCLASVCPLRSAVAQTTAGAIEGDVFDQAGGPLKGVKVQALSPTQIGGARTTYTNEDGHFRFPALTPGLFEVVASAPKMTTVRQKNVQVDLANPANVTLIMEVETATEEVKIVERAPVVNTSNAKISRRMDTEFVNELPGNASNEWWTLLTMTGGVEQGGTDDPYDRPAVRGANGNKNAATIDGFNTTNPVSGAFGQIVDNQALAATEISTAGLGAANGSTPGGAINMVTKSGSNRFEISTQLKYRDPNFTLFKDAGDPDESNRWFFATVNVGGPIIRDRLWYQVSVRGEQTVEYSDYDPTGIKPRDDTPLTVRKLPTMTKLTWQVAPRHKLTLLNLSSVELWDNKGAESRTTDPEAYEREYKWRTLTGIGWESLLTDNLVLRTNVGYQWGLVETAPQNCQVGGECEQQVRIVNQNYNYAWGSSSEHSLDYTKNLQLKASLDYFLDAGKLLGSHNLSLGADFNQAEFLSYASRPGGTVINYRDAQPTNRIQYCSNPVTSPDDEALCNMNSWQIRTNTGRKLDVHLTDAWKVTRHLTVTPGLGVHNAQANDFTGSPVLNNTAVTPHLTFAWDVTHDGRTALRGGYNQYADVAGLDVARRVTQDHVQRTCDYDPATGTFTRNCRLSGGGTAAGTRTIGRPCGSGPDLENQPGCAVDELGIPRTHEFTFGAERELTQGLALSTDFIYRRFDDLFEDYETNRIWNESGTDLNPYGNYKTGRSVQIQDFGARPEAWRRYQAIETTISKREGDFKILGSYTWSRQYGTQDPGNGGISSSLGDVPAQDIYRRDGAYLSRDRRHQIKLLGTYNFTSWLSAGLVYQFLSGTPYNRLYYNTVTGGFRDLHARAGYDPGANPNDPGDDRPLRTPDITRLDAKIRARLKPLIAHDISAFMDITNVLANRATTSVRQNDAPNWGTSSGRMAPTWAFIGLEYKN